MGAAARPGCGMDGAAASGCGAAAQSGCGLDDASGVGRIKIGGIGSVGGRETLGGGGTATRSSAGAEVDLGGGTGSRLGTGALNSKKDGSFFRFTFFWRRGVAKNLKRSHHFSRKPHVVVFCF